MTVKKMPLPKWLTDMFKEIDSKTFGSSFDIFSSESQFQFGTGDWHGHDEIVANLKKFDQEMDTKHTVIDYWDAGEMKFLTGTVGMIFHDGRPSIKPVMSHVIYMEDGSPIKVKHWAGAVGPTNV